MDVNQSNLSRRQFVRLSTASVALIPVVYMYGCGDGGSANQSERPSRRPSPSTQAVPETPAQTSAAGAVRTDSVSTIDTAVAGSQTLAKLEETDTAAKALGYRHSAATVDGSAYPRYQPGHACANCNLFQPNVGSIAGWGGCSIFPNKLVNASGWCNAYIVKG